MRASAGTLRAIVAAGLLSLFAVGSSAPALSQTTDKLTVRFTWKLKGV